MKGGDATIKDGSTEENLIFFNAFFAVLGIVRLQMPGERETEAKRQKKGIKKRDKIFKTLQLILLSYT